MASRRGDEHHARDVYRQWKKAVDAAEDTVVVFTPYLDQLLPTLLKNAPDGDTTVVTDLSPQSGVQDYLGQLRAIARMLDTGIDVRSLPRLHAKVLWVDDRHVIYGSQNFTRYARGSKEATTTPFSDFTDSRFAATLQDWLTQSTPVDRDLIDRLLAAAKEPANAVRIAHRDLASTVDETLLDYAVEQERRQRALQRKFSRSRLMTAAERTPSRLAQGTARLVMGRDSNGGYETLKADRYTDLTRWNVRVDDDTRTVQLDQLYQYPVIDSTTGRMTWARIGQTRITYVHRTVLHGNLFNVGGSVMRVSQSFPRAVVGDHNIVWTFTPVLTLLNDYALPSQAVTVKTLFDGETLHVAGDPEPKSAAVDPDFVATCLSIFKPPTLDTFVADYLTRFRFKAGSLGRDKHNIRDFFNDAVYDFTVVMFHEAPFLVATPVR